MNNHESMRLIITCIADGTRFLVSVSKLQGKDCRDTAYDIVHVTIRAEVGLMSAQAPKSTVLMVQEGERPQILIAYKRPAPQANTGRIRLAKLLFPSEATISPCSVSIVLAWVVSDLLRRSNPMIAVGTNEAEGVLEIREGELGSKGRSGFSMLISGSGKHTKTAG